MQNCQGATPHRVAGKRASHRTGRELQDHVPVGFGEHDAGDVTRLNNETVETGSKRLRHRPDGGVGVKRGVAAVHRHTGGSRNRV